MLQPPDLHLPVRLGPRRILVVGEMRDVPARSGLRGDPEQFGEKAAASAGVDDHVRRRAVPGGDQSERLRREADAVAGGISVEFRDRLDVARARRERGIEEELVEFPARDVVGVVRQHPAQRAERQLEVVAIVECERHARLAHAERPHLLLNPQPLENLGEQRHERFAHDQLRPTAVVEQHHRRAPAREQQRRRRPGRGGVFIRR